MSGLYKTIECKSPLKRKLNEPSIHDMDKTMFKCHKTMIDYKSIRKRCKWNGVLCEIVSHIKKKHKSNYFVMDGDKILFKWQLPQHGDQEDFGILEHKSTILLYTLYYSGKDHDLTFMLWCINEKLKSTYTFSLYNTCTCKSYTTHINSSEGVAHYIILPESEIEFFTNMYGVFKWSLMIV